jgi:hypothetical protein
MGEKMYSMPIFVFMSVSSTLPTHIFIFGDQHWSLLLASVEDNIILVDNRIRNLVAKLLALKRYFL